MLKLVFVFTSLRFEKDWFWDWLDKSEEDKVDINIFNLIESIDLDPSELISQFMNCRSLNLYTTLETRSEKS